MAINFLLWKGIKLYKKKRVWMKEKGQDALDIFVDFITTKSIFFLNKNKKNINTKTEAVIYN